jgi:hypothetical protein
LVFYDSPLKPVGRLFYNHLLLWFWLPPFSKNRVLPNSGEGVQPFAYTPLGMDDFYPFLTKIFPKNIFKSMNFV